MAGESGQPLSAYYGDLLLKWRDVRDETLPFSREAVKSSRAGELTLTH